MQAVIAGCSKMFRVGFLIGTLVLIISPEARAGCSPDEQREILIPLGKLDQQVRNNPAKEVTDELRRTDKANQVALIALVERCGWPTVDQVGSKAAGAAFLIVQHATPELRSRYYPSIEADWSRHPEHREAIALMQDRMQVEQDRPQRYGTQLYKQGDTYVLFPIEDVEHVNQRRAQFGLPGMCEYLRIVNKHGTPVAEATVREFCKP